MLFIYFLEFIITFSLSFAYYSMWQLLIFFSPSAFMFLDTIFHILKHAIFFDSLGASLLVPAILLRSGLVALYIVLYPLSSWHFSSLLFSIESHDF